VIRDSRPKKKRSSSGKCHCHANGHVHSVFATLAETTERRTSKGSTSFVGGSCDELSSTAVGDVAAPDPSSTKTPSPG
jgi:hypothetical protein